MGSKRALVFGLLTMGMLHVACSGDDADGVTAGGSGPAACPAGATDCGGVCRDLSTDDASCGACGNACPAGQTCTGGTCAAPATPPATCAAPLATCGDTCVDLRSDRKNCGKCGAACAASEACADGACKAVCAQGEAICGGACAKIATDAANCGGCGIACTSAQSCVDGRCVVPACGPGKRLADDGASCVACTQTAVADDGPVSFWRLDQAALTDPAADTGTAATKSDGVYLGQAPDVALGAATSAADGDTGLSLKAHSAAAGVLVASYANMPTTAVSVELWVKMAASEDSGCLFSYATGTPPTSTSNAFSIFKPLGKNHPLIVYVGGEGLGASVPIDDGNWNMLDVTWSKSTHLVTVYVNAKQVATMLTLTNPSFAAGGRLYLGQEQDGIPPNDPGLDADQSLVGDLDDVAVFDEVLTPEQITAHYYGHLCK